MALTTKLALAESLKKLLSKRSLDKITVKDITDDCGLNRQTFYYHFQDVYDLLGWIFLQESSKIFEEDYNSPGERLLAVFRCIEENKDLVLNTYYSISREHLEEFLYGALYAPIAERVNDYASELDLQEEDKIFVTNFIKYAMIGLVLDWTKRGMKDDPRVLVDKINIMLGGGIRGFLEDLGHNSPGTDGK